MVLQLVSQRKTAAKNAPVALPRQGQVCVSDARPDATDGSSHNPTSYRSSNGGAKQITHKRPDFNPHACSHQLIPNPFTDAAADARADS